MCVDWSCGKTECRIRNNIVNAFQYHLCEECTKKRTRESCRSCVYGSKISSTYYHCRVDNTLINIPSWQLNMAVGAKLQDGLVVSKQLIYIIETVFCGGNEYGQCSGYWN
jgi:hypothetical protein